MRSAASPPATARKAPRQPASQSTLETGNETVRACPAPGGLLGVGNDDYVEAGTARNGFDTCDFDVDGLGVGAGHTARWHHRHVFADARIRGRCAFGLQHHRPRANRRTVPGWLDHRDTGDHAGREHRRHDARSRRCDQHSRPAGFRSCQHADRRCAPELPAQQPRPERRDVYRAGDAAERRHHARPDGDHLRLGRHRRRCRV